MILGPFWALGASLGLLRPSRDTKVLPERPQRGSRGGSGRILGGFGVPLGTLGDTFFEDVSHFFGECFLRGFRTSFL